MKIDTNTNKNTITFKDISEGECFALPNYYYWGNENMSYCLKLFAHPKVFDKAPIAVNLYTGEIYILKENTSVIPLPYAILKLQ